MAATLLYSPLVGEAFEDGDKWLTYEAGTTTPITTYQDAALSTAHTHPVVADSTGRFAAIFVNSNVGDIKVKVTDSADVEKFTVDNIPINDLAALNTSISTLNTQYTSLNGRLTTAESEIDTLQTESADYESRITTLEGATSPIVESDFTGSNQSLGTNGYQKWPGGLIEQWGKVTSLASSPSTGTTVTFPTAFVTACYNIQTTEATQGFPSNASNWGGVPVDTVTTTSFKIYPQTGKTRDYFWRAVGK